MYINFSAFTKGNMQTHRAIRKLCEELQLDHTCGYISMLCTGITASQWPEQKLEASGEECNSVVHQETVNTTPSDHCVDVKKPDSLDLSCLTCGDRESDWALLDCSFGIPLFDATLNKQVCEKITSNGICRYDRYVIIFTIIIYVM